MSFVVNKKSTRPCIVLTLPQDFLAVLIRVVHALQHFRERVATRLSSAFSFPTDDVPEVKLAIKNLAVHLTPGLSASSCISVPSTHRFSTPKPRLSVKKSFESLSVIVPS